MRALQVERLQRKRDLADGCKVSAQARPFQWDSIRLVHIMQWNYCEMVGHTDHEVA